MSDLENRLRDVLRDESAEVSARPDLADDMVTRGMTVRRRRRAAGGIAALVVLAAVFPLWRTIDTSSGPTPPAVSPSALTPAPDTPTANPPGRLAPWSTVPVDVHHALQQQARVIGVRVGQHGAYDRLVIDMGGQLPSYHVETTPRLVQDASGRRLRLPGVTFLEVRLKPALAHDSAGRLTFEPQRQLYPFPTLHGYAIAGDHEGVVSLGISLTHATTFRVLELTSPSRLVIDLHH